MARGIGVFDVFVASPADVAEERECLEAVIRELNETWQDRLGVRLNLIRWETHAYPGFGDDAQDVINQEMPDTVDVFIGILWSRIGTATRRAESGTLEEFEQAYAQWKKDPSSIRLLMYFKKAAIDIDEIDPEQISKVRTFARSLPEKGAFYWEFDTPGNFESIVRNHLARLVQELTSGEEREPWQGVKPSSEGSPVDGDDDEGLWDLVDRFTDGMEVVRGITGTITDSLTELGDSMKAGSAEISDLDVPNNPSRVAKAKRLINSMANRLDLFADVLLPEAPVLEEAFGQSMGALDRAIEIAPDFGEGGIENLCTSRGSFASLHKSVGAAMETMEQLRMTIQQIPRVTTRFNRAKRNAVNALTKLYRTLSVARTQMESSLALLDQLCEGS